MLYFIFYNRTLQKRFVKRLQALRDCVVSNREKRFPGLLEILDQDDWLNHLPFALPENIYA